MSSRSIITVVFFFLLAASPCMSIRGALFRSGRSAARNSAVQSVNVQEEPSRIPDGAELVALLQSDEQFPAAIGNLHPSSTRAFFRRIQALNGGNGRTAYFK